MTLTEVEIIADLMEFVMPSHLLSLTNKDSYNFLKQTVHIFAWIIELFNTLYS